MGDVSTALEQLLLSIVFLARQPKFHQISLVKLSRLLWGCHGINHLWRLHAQAGGRHYLAEFVRDTMIPYSPPVTLFDTHWPQPADVMVTLVKISTTLAAINRAVARFTDLSTM